MVCDSQHYFTSESNTTSHQQSFVTTPAWRQYNSGMDNLRCWTTFCQCGTCTHRIRSI